ncbi:MAG: hypothetical protein AAF483_26275 [Planctomycetota bacterium]
MKLWWLLFAAFLGMCCTLGFVLLRGEEGKLHGIDHPAVPYVSIGGPAEERTEDLILFGAAFGSLQLITFVTMLRLGFRDTAENQKSIAAILWGGGGVYVVFFLAILVQYSFEISDPDLPFGLPWSAWLAIFIFWPIPFFFIAIYAFAFKRLVFEEADLASES